MKCVFGVAVGTVALASVALAIGAGGVGESRTAPDATLVDALRRCSLDAQALAAVGLSAQTTTSLVNAVRSQLAASPGAIETADANYGAARTQHDVLERRVRAGVATAPELASYAAAVAALETATSSRQALLDSIFATATQPLASASRTTLATLRSNRPQNLPVEYLATSRTPSEWVALRDALATKAIASRSGETLDALTQQYLATIDAEGSVVAAKAALAAGLSSVTAAWNAATDQ